MILNTRPPCVLHVDDEPDTLSAWRDEVSRMGLVELDVRHPSELTEASLVRADLILVDLKLNSWAERDAVGSLALKPCNGLALLTLLQEHLETWNTDVPRAFALYTGAIHDVARGLSPRPHIIARAHNLEWIFDKSLDPATRLAQVAELAQAVNALPREWPDLTSGEWLRQWLGIRNDCSWSGSAWQSLLKCRPPIHEFADHTRGVGALRWMLHKILPYPCFLIDDVHLAARLRVSPHALRHELDDETPLREFLAPAQYSGQFKELMGRRWWRSGIDSLVYDLVPDDPSNLAALGQALLNLAPNMILLRDDMAFPVLDADYRVGERLASGTEVVEIVPDDWPPFADAAWALRTDVEDAPSLRAIARLSDDEEW